MLNIGMASSYRNGAHRAAWHGARKAASAGKRAGGGNVISEMAALAWR